MPTNRSASAASRSRGLVCTPGRVHEQPESQGVHRSALLRWSHQNDDLIGNRQNVQPPLKGECYLATNADQGTTSDTKPRVLASSATRSMRHEGRDRRAAAESLNEDSSMRKPRNFQGGRIGTASLFLCVSCGGGDQGGEDHRAPGTRTRTGMASSNGTTVTAARQPAVTALPASWRPLPVTVTMPMHRCTPAPSTSTQTI